MALDETCFACAQWRWARAHAEIDITGEGGALATMMRKSGSGWRPAVCGEVLQAEGEAYAEFTWLRANRTPLGEYMLMVGVVDPNSVGNGSGTLFRSGKQHTDGRMCLCGNGHRRWRQRAHPPGWPP